MKEDLDMISFGIIADAADCRAFAFQALEAARNNDMEQCSQLIEKGREALTRAHRAQTDLLFEEMNGERKEMSILLIHSQDHLMTASLALELIVQLIENEKQIQSLQQEIRKLNKREEME